MSTIDERIVEMRFDNQQFERGIRTSVDSLENFKKTLNFSGGIKKIGDLDKSMKSLSFGVLADSLDSMSKRFTNLGIIGVTALQNITNSVVDAGKRMTTALTIDPIKSGLTEYETKMNAITTILTNTKSKGTTLDDVNNTLQELNQYADQTIYNFAEMTKNIGTFTAAGIDLKTSATAIKGIANLAAGSGSNAQQASTAMYQLSQALAAGSVKLMDWNSVVNAGMGGELFQNALRSTAKEMGVVIKAGVPFRETLQDGWLTADVLTKTLEKFASDDTLVKAATQVKTFTQLIDTMKESVQSGWAVTWENIIGDREQAIEVLTSISNAFNDLIGPSTDARNNMLKFWNANGGRDDVIKGITNALSTLKQLIEPITKAFRNIFPETTGYTLLLISKNFLKLTENFKIGETTLNNLRRTFEGLFAVVDILKFTFFEILKTFGEVIPVFKPLSSGFLNLTANIGDLLVNLRDAIKSGEGFKEFGENIKRTFGPVVTVIKNFVSGLMEAIGALNTFESDGLDSFSEKVRIAFAPFLVLGNGIMAAFRTVVPAITRVFEGAGVVIIALFDTIIEQAKKLEFSTILDILNGALFMGFLKKLNSFMKELGTITSSGGSIVNDLSNILKGVGGVLESYQKNLNAKTLFTIATSIGVLSLALIGLAMIEPARLTASLEALAILFAQMFVATGTFGKMVTAVTSFNTIKAMATINGLAISIIILSVALKNLSTLNWSEIAKGLVAVGGLMAMLTGAAIILGNNKGVIKGAVGLIAFSLAIGILADALLKISSLNLKQLGVGLLGIGVIMAQLALFMSVTNFGKIGVFKAAGLIGIAVALNLMATAVSTFGNLNAGAILKGLFAVGTILTQLAIFIQFTGGSKKLITTAIGLTILGGALLLFSISVAALGSLSLGTIAKGLLALGGVLLILGAAMKLMPNNMILTGAGLAVVALALTGLTISLLALGTMSLGSIARSLLVLGGALVVLSTGMKLMKGGIGGAVAMTIMAGALMLFVPTLALLSSIPIKGIIVGLAAIAGTFLILGVAAKLMTPLIPSIVLLSGAIGLLGISVLAVGSGVTLFSTGLAILANSIGLLVTSLTTSIGTIIKMVPDLVKLLGVFLTEMAKLLGEIAPSLVNAIVTLVNVMVKALEVSIPAVINVFGNMIVNIMAKLYEILPKILRFGLDLVIELLKGLSQKLPDIIRFAADVIIKFAEALRDNIQRIVQLGIDIMVNFIKGVASRLGAVIQAGADLMLAFINGVADGMRNNKEKMVAAMHNLISAIIETALYVLTSSLKLFGSIGLKILEWLMDGMGGAVPALLKMTGEWMQRTAKKIADSVGEFYKVGTMVVEGLLNGLKNSYTKVTSWAGDLASGVLETMKKTFDINSPAATTMYQGDMVGRGLAQGITNSAKTVKDAAGKVVFTTLDTFGKLKGEVSGKELGAGVAKGLTSSAPKVKAASKKTFDSAVSAIDDAKYYQKMTLEQELKSWESIQKKYQNGSEERKKADREVFRVKQELIAAEEEAIRKAFDTQKAFIDDKKFYNQMSMKEELATLERMQKQYKKGSDERKELDRSVYQLKKDIIRDTADRERAAFENSSTWIDDRKYYEQLSLTEELAAWERVQARYKLGTDERKKADKEVFRVKKELTSRMKDIDDEYADNTKAINQQLKSDIDSLTETYVSSVKSRADSLYKAFGLFDKIEIKPKVNGVDLLNNLKDQLVIFDNWRAGLGQLEVRGMDSGLISELEAMGPEALDKITALNGLTDSELSEYVSLWKIKHVEAREQATSELGGLLTETSENIELLKAKASEELTNYAAIWSTKMSELNGGMATSMGELKVINATAMQEIKTETENALTGINTSIIQNIPSVSSAMTLLTDKLVATFKTVKWNELGFEVTRGIVSGLNSGSSLVISTAQQLALSTLQTAKKTLGIKSPSREFMEIGRFANLGLAEGLSKFSSLVVSASSNVGDSAMGALKTAFASVSEMISSDITTDPVIRPVLDMTNIEKGLGGMNSKFGLNPIIPVTRGVEATNGISQKMQGMDSQGGIFASLLDGIRDIMTVEQPVMDLNGTLTVNVTNDRGEIIGIAETAIKDLLRRESR